MNSLLTRHGYKVLATDSGPTALRVWQSHADSISLLITDMVMLPRDHRPGVGGGASNWRSQASR